MNENCILFVITVPLKELIKCSILHSFHLFARGFVFPVQFLQIYYSNSKFCILPFFVYCSFFSSSFFSSSFFSSGFEESDLIISSNFFLNSSASAFIKEKKERYSYLSIVRKDDIILSRKKRIKTFNSCKSDTE